jgi:2-dehydropantoate 2-reductase
VKQGTVAVLGPGAVGGALAVRLAASGLRVICVATPRTAAVIERDGLGLSWLGREIHERPQAVTQLREPVTLLLVTVKRSGLEDALARVSEPLLQQAVVLPLLNGLEHLEPIRAAVGPRVAAGSISISAHLSAPGRVVQTTEFTIVRMASRELAREELERTASLLAGAGIDARVEQSEQAVLWEKAVRLGPLAAATVASGLSIGELRSDAAWWPRLRAAVDEACAVAGAFGVAIVPEKAWRVAEGLPRDTTTSSARDVQAGRASELDAIAGSVLRAGERMGLACPELRALLAEAAARAA